MSKVKYVIEMDEDEYKRVKNAECSYDGFEKGTFGYYLNIIQKTATPITESDDCVSRQYIESKVEELENICANAPGEVLDLLADIKNTESVTPKREENTVSEEVYTEEYTRRKALEFENYVLKQNMQALRCGNGASDDN